MGSRIQLAEVFPPGEFIREELEARGWTQSDLAEILDRPLPRVNEIIQGKTGVTAETARALSQAFDTSAEYWLNLEARYRLSQLGESDGEVRARARVYEAAPVKDMQRRGWIRKTRSHEELEQELCRFFSVESLDRAPDLAVAARASVFGDGGSITAEQLAWCTRGAQLASCQSVGRYSARALDAAVEDLRQLAAHAEDVRRVPRVLASAGIRFAVVQHLPRSRIDGAVIWLSKQSPAVLISMRYDRIDHFWHTLMHELRHVRNRDGNCVDTDIGAERHQDVELRADREAAATLVPADEMENFFVRVGPNFSTSRIIRFAKRIGVHPGIVAGQVQHRLKRYHAYRQMLVKVRDILISEAMTDGWGVTPSI